MDVDSADSDNEGQLLIDESVDARKRPKSSGRRQKATAVKPRKKQPLKIVVKARPAKQKNDKAQKAAEQVDNKPVVGTRVSTRVRKQPRKHSPPPIVSKIKIPKNKVKAQIKNLKEPNDDGQLSTVDSITMEQEKNESQKEDPQAVGGNNVDIEAVSDEEEGDVLYSSSIVSKNKTTTKRKPQKIKRKAGIRLRLSLGKVLAAEVTEGIITDDTPNEAGEIGDETTWKSEGCEPDVAPDPLRISRKQLLTEETQNDASFKEPDPKIQQQLLNDQPSGVENQVESLYYSSTPEHHKPLTLKLSVGRPKAQTPPDLINSTKPIAHTCPQAFPNIRRSWGIAPKTPEVSQVQQPAKAVQESPVSPQHGKLVTMKEVPNPSNDSQITTSPKPYFSTGLQSLLDVVSVKLHEHELQNKSENLHEVANNSSKNSLKGGPQKDLPPTRIPAPGQGLPAIIATPSSTVTDDDGHLPSLPLPKMELNFSSKRRPRSKSVAALSPPCNDTDNPLVEVKQTAVHDVTCHFMTEKEQRRFNKKKILNSDFVDPDTVVQGDEPERKKAKKKMVNPSAPTHKAIGTSLLMPQMTCSPNSTAPKPVTMGSTCSLPVKLGSARRPRKGMATAKQRLANKLKIGKAFTF